MGTHIFFIVSLTLQYLVGEITRHFKHRDKDKANHIKIKKLMFLHSKGCGTGKLILAVLLTILSKAGRFFLDSIHVTLNIISLMDRDKMIFQIRLLLVTPTELGI